MNIISNYSSNYSIVNSNKVSKNVKNGAISELNNSSNVSFQGNLINHFLPKNLKKVSQNSYHKEFILGLASILGVDEKMLLKKTQGRTVGSVEFLESMSNRYNSVNWGKKASEKEDPNIVLELFDRIKYPSSKHKAFVESVSIGMTDVKKCFDLCEDDPKKLSTYRKAYKELESTMRPKEYMSSIVSSPNVKEYINNIKKYVPFFTVSKDAKAAVCEIDQQLSENCVDLISKKANSEAEALVKNFPKTAYLSKEMFVSGYSAEKIDLIHMLNIKFSPSKETLEAGDAKGIARIYKSTTEKNINFRSRFVDTNYVNFGKRDKYDDKEINNLAALLELADKDKNTKKFLKNAMNSFYRCSATGYVELIDKYGSEYLSKNSKKVVKIIKKNHGKIDKIKKDIDAYEQSPVNKMIRAVKGLFGNKPVQHKSVYETVGFESVSKPEVVPEVPFVKPINVPIFEKPAEVLESSIPEINTEPIQKIKKSRVFTPYVPKQPSAKKLVVINDVNNIIEKKLGSKILSEQSSIYADKATKIRAGLLPEIFDSIKDTRAADRSKGIFSKSKSVSNEDAVDLYTRINGKNKKLVNYLLKVRNAEGQRAYNVKDIINILTDANREIIQGKSKSTKLNRFSSKDERAIYNRMFEEKFAQHGTLPKKLVKKS